MLGLVAKMGPINVRNWTYPLFFFGLIPFSSSKRVAGFHPQNDTQQGTMKLSGGLVRFRVWSELSAG